jgi:threonine aldolase
VATPAAVSIDAVPDRPVDLRSDTVTRPTPEMRRAMAEAEVGDDGYGEDPTVNELQEVFAARIGKAASVFVPSGTMANQIAVRILTTPGSLLVAGRRQHVVAYERGAAAMNAGVQVHALEDEGGVIAPEAVAAARAAAAYHHAAPSLVCLENTHMAAGGVPVPLAALAALRVAAGPVPIHLDGARLFNAEVATGVPVAELAAGAVTVMCCLSKGLCAPVGSLLAGPAELMDSARVERSRLGGGMRQAGVLAAAGLVALRTMVARLADDHARATRLAQGAADRWPTSGLDPASVRTNVVVVAVPSPERVLHHLAQAGVLAGSVAPGMVRFVTHHDVDDRGIGRALAAIGTSPC